MLVNSLMRRVNALIRQL